MINTTINRIYQYLLSEKRMHQFEKGVYLLAILTFIVHVGLIFLSSSGWVSPFFYINTGITPDILSGIYTPFTVILLFEVYLLIYYLPHSITTYLGKQYEIITLIVIRGIFDRLAALPEGFGFTDLKGLLIAFTVFIALVLLIFCFYKLSENRKTPRNGNLYSSHQYYNYVMAKRFLAIVLLVIFLFLFVNGFMTIRHDNSITFYDLIQVIKTMNRTFFSAFFTVLILTEVLLLLLMYKINSDFIKVIRNSGFILSTVLLKLSFLTTGLNFLYIILVAVAFGVVTLALYKLYIRHPFLIDN